MGFRFRGELWSAVARDRLGVAPSRRRGARGSDRREREGVGERSWLAPSNETWVSRIAPRIALPESLFAQGRPARRRA